MSIITRNLYYSGRVNINFDLWDLEKYVKQLGSCYTNFGHS